MCMNYSFREKSEKARKREEKKAEKKAKKATIKSQKAAEENATAGDKDKAPIMEVDGRDFAQERYGDLPMNQSREKPKDKNFISIGILGTKLAGQKVWVRARLHTSRATGKNVKF